MKALKKSDVTLGVLRSKCQEVESSDEAQVIIALLESILDDYGDKYISISAPETNVLKRVAIIRTPDVSLDLVNPRIVESSGKMISFNEPCISFPEKFLNCFRYDSIIIENGFHKELIRLKGQAAAIVQHEIDHLNGVVYQDRKIKLAIVRDYGKIRGKDVCPCGSGKRFAICCDMTTS